jgi:putative addiction module component (TIGR02574 family)
MTRQPSEILKEALELPPEARASIADSLLASLDQEFEPGASAESESEIQRRIAEVESGAVKAISWSDARDHLMSRLRDER